MTRVTTGSRLHFGLLRLPPSPDWVDDGTRYFGGAGLMVEQPRIVVNVDRSADWKASGPSADRALAVARRFANSIGTQEQFAICVECSPLEHVGLGVGTQLELAVAAAITRAMGRDLGILDVARELGRGQRSAVGVHGFFRGGFILDHGKRRPNELSTVECIPFPTNWRAVILIPPSSSEWHGDREESAFAAIGAQRNVHMESLLFDAMVPAVTHGDFAAFAEALHEYNSAAGSFYYAALGVRQHSFAATNQIEWLARHGANGTGQSSWGPTAFGFFDDADEAAAIAKSAAAAWPMFDVVDTGARNQMAVIE
jgi:beta-ribofuranosylaminobenzene 5'-phosphate synthase